jgi:multiple sugar transport system permease protein
MRVEETKLTAIQFEEPKPSWSQRLAAQMEASSKQVLVLPAVLLVLTLSIFPLLVSLYLSLSNFKFVKGGFQITFVGLKNYDKLLSGSEQRHFLGKLGDLSPLGILVLALFIGIMVYLLFRYTTSSRFRLFGLAIRIITIIIASSLAILIVSTLSGEGLPGSLVVTLIFVFGGVTFQYLIGLGLAMLLTQNLPGKRFFRIVFLLPMMITPVGIGFLFRMMTDTSQGPFKPIWNALGLASFSWVNTPGGARMGVLIGDVWQWTPFMFIILLAALEGVSRETIEAAMVDGTNRFQLFRYIVLPEIVPVSTTVILIRLIEAFKIIDMPAVLTGGGPGTATESITLYAYNNWRALDLGTSSALAYLLLFVVTFVAMVFVNFIRRRILEGIG